MAAPLFHTDCPSCGAPVRSMSASAVTLVCSYCHSLLIREGETLRDSGEDSALLEDFSPLQIGTSGVFNKQPFTLVGRLQARYDAGVWNEWYLLFADGSDGWLAEAGDQYVLTRPGETAVAETMRRNSLTTVAVSGENCLTVSVVVESTGRESAPVTRCVSVP